MITSVLFSFNSKTINAITLIKLENSPIKHPSKKLKVL